MFLVMRDSVTEKMVLLHPHELHRSVWLDCPHEWRLLEQPEAGDVEPLDQ